MLKTMQQLADEARQSVPEVDAAFVRQHVDAQKLPFLLIDVREPHEQAQGVIPGATPIPRGILEMNIQRAAADEKQPIVCYCGGGTRSLFAAEQLKRMGYSDVKSMSGGFRAWTTGGHPVVKPQ